MAAIWPTGFELKRPNELWMGFAATKVHDDSSGSCTFEKCLLLRVDGAQCIAAAVVESITGNERSVFLNGVIDNCGEQLPMDFISLIHMPAPQFPGRDGVS